MLQLGFCAEVLETDSEKDILICKKNLTLLARASCGFFYACCTKKSNRDLNSDKACLNLAV